MRTTSTLFSTLLATGAAGLLALSGCQRGPEQDRTPYAEDDYPAEPTVQSPREPGQVENVPPARPGGPAARTPGAMEGEQTGADEAMEAPSRRGLETQARRDIDQEAAAEQPSPETDRAAVDDPMVIEVEVPADMAAQCQMGPKHVFFEYNEEEPGQVAQQRLQEISDCLTDGGLAGRDVLIVGYADPRGTAQHNRELATQRARSVAEALTKQGVKNARTEVMSMGETAARDKQAAYSWSRRATIRTLPDTYDEE